MAFFPISLESTCFCERSSSLKLQFCLILTYLLMYLLYNRVIISTPLFKYVWSLKQRADPLTWNIHQGKEILKEVDSWRIFWRGQLCSEVYKSECLVCCLLQELPNVCILGVLLWHISKFLEDSVTIVYGPFN